MRLLNALLYVCLLLIAAPACAQPLETGAVFLDLDAGARQGNPIAGIEYLPGYPEATFAQVAAQTGWQSLDQTELDRSLKHLWLRFDVQQPALASKRYLKLRWPVLDEVVLRMRDQAGQWSAPLRAGDTVPHAEQPMVARHPLFPLALAAGEQASVYLKISVSEPIALPLELIDGQTLARQEQHEPALINLFFGGILVILLYNLSLFVFTRELIYLLYAVYLGSAVAYALSLTGIGPLYLWTPSHWMGTRFYGLAAAATFCASQLFARRFLDLPKYGGWPLRLNDLNLGYWALMIVAILFIPELVPYLHVQTCALISSLLGLVLPIYLWMRGNHAARLFTFAWASLIVFTVIHLLALEGTLPLNFFTLESQLLGIFAEFVLLSIALAGHINRERRGRLRAQKAALESSRQLAIERGEKLEAQQRALEIQRQANEALERRVRERTQALEDAKRGLELVNTQLERLSVTDALTLLYNRRYFDGALQDQLHLSQQTGQPLALLILDLDHFKQLNDRYGHAFGDDCLRAVGKVLASHTQRHGEIAARYGGEEFVALLPNANQDAAVRVAERIRLAISELRLTHDEGPVSLTASIGVACLASDEGPSAQTLFQAADAALYAAKHGGRNRVVAADAGSARDADPLPA